MPVSGKYVLEKNENYEQFLKVLGVPDARAEKLLATKPNLEVELTPDTLKVITKSGDLTFDNCVPRGKAGKISIAGIEYELNIDFVGKKGTGTFELLSKSKKGNVVIDVTDTGFVETLIVEGVTAKRHFKRL